jgi:predicted flap endonuclease-1-like 5' DNA nuclease
MMASLQSTTPLVPGGPEWLTLSFALIGAGVLIALLILFVGARLAGKRRRAERELREQDAAYYVEEDIPTARPITPRPPEFAAPLAAAPAYVPEPEPAYVPAPEPQSHHVEGAPAREPEPEAFAEAPNPAAEPVDSAPAGLTAASEDPPVAAEGEPVFEPAPEPAFADEPIAAAAPFDASPATLATDLAEPEPVAQAQHIAAEEAPELAAPEPAPAPSAPDDLTRMKGVGPRLAERLHTVGVTSFAQIAALSPEDAAALDSKLGDFQGRLDRDRWIDQARYLASDDIAGFEETFGKL